MGRHGHFIARRQRFVGASSFHSPGFNGYAIRNDSNATNLNKFLGNTADTEGKVVYGNVQDPRIIASDASNVASCAYDVAQASGLYVQNEFTTEQSNMSSGVRELLAVLAALRAGARKIKHAGATSRTVFWLTDSANLVIFLTKGSPKKHIQKYILAVFRLARELNLHIHPIHLLREDYRIQTADFGSRYYDPDDWTVDNDSFSQLVTGWQPTIDLFAHVTNTKCERFYSYGDAPHTAGVDAFAQDWDNETAWCCPPTRMVIQAIHKTEASVMRAILVVPAWTSAAYWPYSRTEYMPGSPLSALQSSSRSYGEARTATTN